MPDTWPSDPRPDYEPFVVPRRSESRQRVAVAAVVALCVGTIVSFAFVLAADASERHPEPARTVMVGP